MPEPAGRFSTTKPCPRRSLSFTARMRPTTSVPPPGAKGTTTLTGRDGQLSCASELAAMRDSATAARTRIPAMLQLRLLLQPLGFELLELQGHVGLVFEQRLHRLAILVDSRVAQLCLDLALARAKACHQLLQPLDPGLERLAVRRLRPRRRRLLLGGGLGLDVALQQPPAIVLQVPVEGLQRAVRHDQELLGRGAQQMPV